MPFSSSSHQHRHDHVILRHSQPLGPERLGQTSCGPSVKAQIGDSPFSRRLRKALWP
jgi:hypothetical protein